MNDSIIPENRLTYFEGLARIHGQLDGVLALELIEEIRRLREKLRKEESKISQLNGV